MIPVVELLRVSGDSQAQDGSLNLPAQHQVNATICHRFGLRIVESIEVVVSGATIASTPDMQRVLRCITEGRAQGVVVAEYSRLFRPERWSDMTVLQTIQDYGAQIYRPAGPIDLATETGMMQATMENLYAALERRRIAQRFMRGKEEIRRRGGNPNPAALPTGLTWSKEGGWAYTDDAGRVGAAFRRFLAGEHNLSALGRSLGFPSVTLRDILANVVYTGWRVYDEKRDPSGPPVAGKRDRKKVARAPDEVIRVQLPLEPLVSEEDFATVQQLLALKRRSQMRWPAADHFIYSGFLDCADCDLTVYGARKGSKTAPHFYYSCRSKEARRRPEDKEPCENGYMRRDVLEGLLDAVMAEQLTRPDVLLAGIAAYTASIDADWRRAPSPDAVRDRLAKAERKRERLTDLYIDERISREEYDRRQAPILAETEALRAELAQAASVAAMPALDDAAVAALVHTLAEWRFLDTRARRRVLEVLTPTFYVRKYAVTGVQLPLVGLTRVVGDNDGRCGGDGAGRRRSRPRSRRRARRTPPASARTGARARPR